MPDVSIDYSWNIANQEWCLLLRVDGVWLSASVPLKDVFEDHKAVFRKFIQMIHKWQEMQRSQ